MLYLNDFSNVISRKAATYHYMNHYKDGCQAGIILMAQHSCNSNSIGVLMSVFMEQRKPDMSPKMSLEVTSFSLTQILDSTQY